MFFLVCTWFAWFSSLCDLFIWISGNVTIIVSITHTVVYLFFFFSKQEILKQAARGSSGDNKRWEDKTTEISFKVFA